MKKLALTGICITAALISAARYSSAAGIASEDTFGSGANAFVVRFARVGNIGNADDVNNPRGIDDSRPGDGGTPYGGVPYVYRMAVTEVPQEWVTKATNLGLTHVTAGAWAGSRPAANVTWYEAAAFVNWLNTSTGHQAAYNLNATATAITLWDGAHAWQAGGENRYRHKDAYYFLPSDDEWYKAAYHKNDGVTPNYWDYATGSNMVPTAVVSGADEGTAVYNGVSATPAGVDDNGGLSPYGTRGQNGNVAEWQESAFTSPNDNASENRAIRGGVWAFPKDFVRSAYRGSSHAPTESAPNFGIRVASVPEPSAALLIVGLALMVVPRRRRSTSMASGLVPRE